MGLKSYITPLVAGTITSKTTQSVRRGAAEFGRKITNAAHKITFYHRVNDPYSYLLLQTIPTLIECYNIKVNLEVVLTLPEDAYPEPEMLEAYAIEDSMRSAEFYGLSFPTNPTQPSLEQSKFATAILLGQEKSENLFQIALEVTGTLWGNGTTTLESCANRYGKSADEDLDAIIKKQQDKIVNKGHYLSGTLHYGGEWYWGVDRLSFLLERLKGLGAQKLTHDHLDMESGYQRYYDDYSTLKKRPKQVVPLDFYFSFRSPYSYLALERTFKLAEHYRVPLNIKPILPMVMRGLPVPKNKRMYIFLDSKREAEKNGVPFGKACDPLGAGVERCMAIYDYAKNQNKEQDYLLSIAKGIWSEGVDVATDAGLAKLVTRAGLDWPMAKSYLKNEDWRDWAEQNRKNMIALGIWGVPTYQYADLAVWGQDRFWAIENKILAFGES